MNRPDFMKYTKEELLDKEIEQCREILKTTENKEDYEKLLSFLLNMKDTRK